MTSADVEDSRNAAWRRSENLVSGNGRAVAIGMERRTVDAGAHRLTRQAGRERFTELGPAEVSEPRSLLAAVVE